MPLSDLARILFQGLLTIPMPYTNFLSTAVLLELFLVPSSQYRAAAFFNSSSTLFQFQESNFISLLQRIMTALYSLNYTDTWKCFVTGASQRHRAVKSVKSCLMRDRPLFLPGGGEGGYCDFQEAGNFFYHQLSTCKLFSPHLTVQTIFKFLKFPITGVAPADNLFQIHLWGRQFISAIFLMQTTFSQSWYTPWKNNGPSLKKDFSLRHELDWKEVCMKQNFDRKLASLRHRSAWIQSSMYRSLRLRDGLGWIHPQGTRNCFLLKREVCAWHERAIKISRLHELECWNLIFNWLYWKIFNWLSTSQICINWR